MKKLFLANAGIASNRTRYDQAWIERLETEVTDYAPDIEAIYHPRGPKVERVAWSLAGRLRIADTVLDDQIFGSRMSRKVEDPISNLAASWLENVHELHDNGVLTVTFLPAMRILASTALKSPLEAHVFDNKPLVIVDFEANSLLAQSTLLSVAESD